MLVLSSGVAAAVTGAILVFLLEYAAWARLSIVLAWLGLSALELGRLLRGYGRVDSIRVQPDRRVVLGLANGQRLDGELAAGSIVTQRLAWLRIRARGVPGYCELIRGNSRKNNDWRRLQVIWRHVGE